ncbi:UDP-N-acetylglucosamine 2-epimerase [Pseudonocardiaceae bacterium YIM PH 21723]|nr:UDP-N-acetylglucosamine 2-epimerase [Pseudonocardiaceae bacterium YIM PH 21723]
MIAFIVGTTAELIKIAPVYHAIAKRGSTPQIWFTAQHVNEVSNTLRDLGLPEPDEWLVPQETAQNLSRPAQVPGWVWRVASTSWRKRKRLRAKLAEDGKPGMVIVHGDTFTTPYGSFIGRFLLGAKIAHVEAGLRSGSLLSPLPEELNRRVAGQLVSFHFAPTDVEVHNLRKAPGTVINTKANTVIDAVRMGAGHEPTMPDLPAEFGLSTLHRFELMSRPAQYAEVLRLLKKSSERMPILYLAGAHEREVLTKHDLMGLFDENFQLRPKLNYTGFLPLLAKAKFVVTDSGGLQEECAYLGQPAAIHRERTERQVGIGTNVVLTEMRLDVLERFLSDPEALRAPSLLDKYSPSDIIADTLVEHGFC